MGEEHFSYTSNHRDTRPLYHHPTKISDSLRTKGSGCLAAANSFSPSSNSLLASLFISMRRKWLILRVGVQRSIITEALSQYSSMLQKDLTIGRPGKHRLQASLIKSAHSLLVCQNSLFHIRSNGRQEMAVHRSILIKMEWEGETVCRPKGRNNRGCIKRAIS